MEELIDKIKDIIKTVIFIFIYLLVFYLAIDSFLYRSIMTIIWLIALLYLSYVAYEKIQDIREQKLQQSYSEYVYSKLKSINFYINRRIYANFRNEVFIDEENYKIAFRKNDNLKIIDFIDILDFEFDNEEYTVTNFDQSIIDKSLRGKSKIICSSIVVRVFVNDLNNGQITIPFLSYEVDKNSNAYWIALENAKELVSVLTYIKNNISY